MATAAITNTFVAGTPAVAPDVNANFTDLVTFLNNSATHRDGTKAFTGNVDAGANRVINVSDGVSAQDAVTKSQLDAVAASLTPASEPAGVIRMTGKATANTGWLLCQGQAVSRATYADLFTAIGVGFGAGDGVTTFNLPDFRDYFPVGTSGSKALGSTGGSANAVVVSHSHTASDSGHTHGFDDTYRSTTSAVASGSSFGYSPNLTSANDTTDSGNANITVATSGVSGTNANLPPYRSVNFEIRTGL